MKINSIPKSKTNIQGVIPRGKINFDGLKLIGQRQVSLIELGKRLMRHRGFSDSKEYFRTLVREDYDRRLRIQQVIRPIGPTAIA